MVYFMPSHKHVIFAGSENQSDRLAVDAGASLVHTRPSAKPFWSDTRRCVNLILKGGDFVCRRREKVFRMLYHRVFRESLSFAVRVVRVCQGRFTNECFDGHPLVSIGMNDPMGVFPTGMRNLSHTWFSIS